jgi:AraC-like DNA-binding protein
MSDLATSGIDMSITEKLIQILGNLPEQATHPLISIGLKEVAAMLIQEREKQNGSPDKSRESTTLDRITQYIQENISEDISIDMLAEISFMSKASFYRYFKTRFNTTPNVFINQERLRQAYQIMQDDPQRSIQSVCQEVGFKSTSYFIKLFRKHFGLTPKQYQLQKDKRQLSVDVGF